ncbi:MAG: hypothetical protein K5656_07485 [Lachnospiraceae bacterium]|nr:hypothetical protein [Lachnospiraceae bacterium]
MICLGSYLSVVYYAKVNGKKQNEIVTKFFEFFDNDIYELDNEAASNIVRGVKNPPVTVTDGVKELSPEQYADVVDYFKNNILNLIKENEITTVIETIKYLINDDDAIYADTVVEVISGIKKNELAMCNEEAATFLAGVYLFVLRNTDNRVEENSKKYAEDCWNKVKEGQCVTEDNNTVVYEDLSINYKGNEIAVEYKNREVELMLERIDQEATSFCINHDEEKSLIPLCRVAKATNLTHSHVRTMYNDFCSSTQSVQKRILELNEISEIDVYGDSWWIEYMDKFLNDYNKFQLGEQQYRYVFKQYFYRLFYYGDLLIFKYRNQYFKRSVNIPMLAVFRNTDFDVLGLLDEYIYYSKDELYKGKIEPPMNRMWRELDFEGCEESDLAAFLALFIIGTCYAIPRSECRGVGEYDTPGLSEIETAEDLFYLALLVLYETYC